MHFRHTFATFLPKNLYFKKFGGENSNLAEFYSRFGGQLSISSGTAEKQSYFENKQFNATFFLLLINLMLYIYSFIHRGIYYAK